MIKKLILITGLMLSANLWADMDNRCYVNGKEDGYLFGTNARQHIRDNCQRNNILQAFNLSRIDDVDNAIAFYCRYDRNVKHYKSEMSGWRMTCVLYDNEPRDIQR